MKVTRTPQRRDGSLTITVCGDIVTLNGEFFDFSELCEGGRIRQEDTGCDWLASDVTRVGGENYLTVIDPQAAG